MVFYDGVLYVLVRQDLVCQQRLKILYRILEYMYSFEVVTSNRISSLLISRFFRFETTGVDFC